MLKIKKSEISQIMQQSTQYDNIIAFVKYGLENRSIWPIAYG